MKAPIFIRPLTKDEHRTIQKGLRSSSAFVLCRGPLLLSSERQEHATAIAKALGCNDQTVRNVISGLGEHGLAVREKESCRPHRLRTSIPDEALFPLQDLLHRSPREFGIKRSLWTLSLAAKISFEQGLIPTPCYFSFGAPCSLASGHDLETCQALDYQSRSDVSPKKRPVTV